MHDITSPEEFFLGQPSLWQSPWFWIMIVSACVLIGLLIHKLTRGKNAHRKRQRLLQSATEALLALKQKSGELAPQVLAVRISLIIRQYLEAVFNDPALFETDEELSLRPNAMTQVDAQYRSQVIDHLHLLSELKYMASGQQDHIAALFDQAIELLDNVGQAATDQNHSPSE